MSSLSCASVFHRPCVPERCDTCAVTGGKPTNLCYVLRIAELEPDEGTKAAPFLAMRTLQQLANDDANMFPRAAVALRKSFYMDDLLEGSETVEDAKNLQLEIISMLKRAGMNIRKWSSNASELIEGLSADQIDAPLDFKYSESRKTLGIRWNPKSDSFTFQNKFENFHDDDLLTKRQLLSYISQLFDPLGWLSPLTVRAKLLFQATWSDQNNSWDDKLSETIIEQWRRLKLDFQNLNILEIPRYLGDSKFYEFHGFCDASERAYACCIYVVTRDNKGVYTSRLLTAKTKLCPIKNKQSLPRLELCSAVLLSRLLKLVMEIYPNNGRNVYAWTDSMVVLGWLHGNANKWKQFVSSRVYKITNIIPSSQWHHVRSDNNAADCATRGLTIKQLSEHSVWWEGPAWLLHFDSKLNTNQTYDNPTVDVKKSYVNLALYDNNAFMTKLLKECSSLRRVVTTVGWFSRYIAWLRNKRNTSRLSYLTLSEINNSYNLIIKHVQHIEFQNDISRLNRGLTLKKDSKLLCLNPYVDDNDGLLRVGGRLNNSGLQPSAKHPIIIPSHCRLTELLIQQAHVIMLHGGPSLTLSYIREKFWIISGLRTVKRELRKCVKCRRFSSEKSSQLMADLPEPRVTPSRAFTHTGVDFTGHFDIKANKGRGVKTVKGYVAVFVCLSTKAVHLELVSDLSTPGFLAAFRRFCARRGSPSHMYSDNGTNFIGANRLLKREYQEILHTLNVAFLKESREYNIQWLFNAPAYPSAGGLWEAAVKRLKYHLRRVVGEQKLTYEEFITLLHQIEACLNSRPLIALTESPDDLYLTPGHFLIGGSLVSRPQADPFHINLTTRWRMVQAMNKQVWKSWSSDYLQQLQVRSKWSTPRKNVEVDDIVVVKEDNLPPGKWLLGRVTTVHPGKDGHVRVATVKTQNGELKRPILKLSVLPTKENTPAPVDKVDQISPDDYNTAEVNRDVPASRYTRRSNRLCHFITLALLLFITIISPAQSNYNVSYFNSTQSIYFDKVSDLSLIRDEWKMIVYYNMTSYWLGLNKVHNYVARLNEQMYAAKLPSQYKSILYQLQQDLTEIEHYNVLLRNRIGRRKKRGLINGVGYLANTLFGVLDERFATQYEKDIEKISINENHLQILLKNQTSVIEGQYNILRRNEVIMNKQFSILDNHLRNISNYVSAAQSHDRDELHVLSSALCANIVISSLRRIQDNVIDTVTDISHGHINSHLLPPDQLREQMNVIASQLQGDLTLSVDKQSINELYKLMKVKAKVGYQYLIMEVKIPLVNKESLQLDRLLSLPHRHYYIKPITPYIAFNLRKNLLLLLTETDIQTCMHISTSRPLLCTIDKPVYEVQITKSICSMIINNKTMCNTKVAACEDRWIKLHNGNRWLFTCCELCLVRLFCPDGIHESSLTGNGLLDIDQGCTLKSNGISIYSQNSNLYSTVNVQNNIQDVLETSILNKIVNSTFDTNFVPEDHSQLFNRLKTQMNNLQDESSTSLSVHDIHHYSVLYTVVLIIILAAAAYALVRWRKARRASHVAIEGSVKYRAAQHMARSASVPVISSVSEVSKVLSKSSASVDRATLTTPVAIPRAIRLNIPCGDNNEISE